MKPMIVYFSSFQDTLPHEVPYVEFTDPNSLKQTHPIVYDLITLSELDVTRIKTENRLIRRNLTQIASGNASRKFSEFWDQNKIEFVFDVDSTSAAIFISDVGKDYAYKPEQRSEGFQWFLSFYLRLEAAGNEKNNIILVDEPGLYLHFRAQKNVLDVFQKLVKNNQILFTTHSPYMIDTSNLNQVRLVVKDDDKTTIKNTFHEGGTVFDTLTPIITAIGLDLTKDLFFSKMGNNVAVEGVSDYYYLRGMIDYLTKYEKYEFPNDITLIPCVGHTTISIMVSFLIALGLKYKILLDKKGTTRTTNKLKKDGMRDDEILFSGTSDNESIEDLFDEKDKAKYNLVGSNESKGIVARNFYEMMRMEKPLLEKQTIINFRKLLDEIKKEIATLKKLDASPSLQTTKAFSEEFKKELDGYRQEKKTIQE